VFHSRDAVGTGGAVRGLSAATAWTDLGFLRSGSRLQDEFPEGRDLLLDQGITVLVERWRIRYNTIKPHSPLGLQTAGTQGLTNLNAGPDGGYLAMRSRATLTI
jgi:hypothetical protein